MSLAAAVLLALVPGLLTWWWGRALSPAHPALRARMQEAAGRTRGYFFAVLVGMLVFGGSHAPWLLALLLLVRSAAVYSIRRRVFGESWGYLAYLSHALRFWAAFAMFWM